MYPTQHPAAATLGAFGQGTQAFIDQVTERMAVGGQGPTETEMVALIREASYESAMARERGDMEAYQMWRDRMFTLTNIWKGVGDTRDLLEQEQERKTVVQQFLEPVSGMMQSVALGAAVLLGFMFLTRGK